MRRVGFMIERIADPDNLRLAFYKAQCGKSEKAEVAAYRNRLDENLLMLRNQILSGKIDVGEYKLFKIFDPKERVVCAAAFPERVLHHAIMNICLPYFEKHFIATTYANRKYKGIYKALERATKAMGNFRFVAKLDVRKYFDSIDHTILSELLSRQFKDRALLSIFSSIIDTYEVTPKRGLPIGNLTSQYFANFYLSGLDHYAKEELGIPCYLRYMDDILFFGNERLVIKEQVAKITDYVQQRLRLNLKIPIIQPTSDKVAFLGYSLRNRAIVLTTRSKRRFEKKYADAESRFCSGEYTDSEYQAHLIPLFAFVKHGYTKIYRHKIIEKVAVVGVEPRESWRQLEQQC